MLGALDAGCHGSSPLALLGALGLFGEGVQAAVEALCLDLKVTRYAAFFLDHAETTHGGHQGLLLLAELQHLLVTSSQRN